MTRSKDEHRTLQNFSTGDEHRTVENRITFDDSIETWTESYLMDRSTYCVPRTVSFYMYKLKAFRAYCEEIEITDVMQVTTDVIRKYLIWLENRGYSQGGIHAFYRTLRSFMYWYENEVEPDWKRNPIHRIKAPKVPQEVLDPVSDEHVAALLSVCDNTFNGKRDRAIILALLDTGVRASELCGMDIKDLDPRSGEILVRKGKGGKPRTVYLGKTARRALRAYLSRRKDDNSALWVQHPGYGDGRLKREGLRMIFIRRAKAAGIPTPQRHAFRRAFALKMLRQGVDLHTLAKLMGHANTAVLARYLKVTTYDTRKAFKMVSPVDKADL